jgi:hypothetical protein
MATKVNGGQGRIMLHGNTDKLMGAVVLPAIQTAAEPRIVGLPWQTSGSEVIRSSRDIS